MTSDDHGRIGQIWVQAKNGGVVLPQDVLYIIDKLQETVVALRDYSTQFPASRYAVSACRDGEALLRKLDGEEDE